MQLNNQELHLFFEGMKNSREQHAEENKSFEYGLNGRLTSRNGVLSYSSIKGTVEVYNNPSIVKYLGYFSFSDELVLFLKYNAQIIGENIIINREKITGKNVFISIPFGNTVFTFSNELSANAVVETYTETQPLFPSYEQPLESSYEENIIDETIDFSYYYSLGSSNVPNFEVCNIGGINDAPEYNKVYADAIIILKKENDRTLTPRIAWLGNLNWDINRKITTVGIYENSYYKRVYFTDNLNPLRVFNLKDNKLNYRIAEEFDINQRSVLLQPVVMEITDGGSIKAMTVQYAYLLITENGQATPFSPYSEIVIIPKDSDGYDFMGGDISETTNKLVKLKCPIISTLYKEVQCIAIEYEADTIPTAIRNLGKKDVSSIVYFTHNGNESEFSENFTLSDIIETNNIWTYCNDITTKRNKLIAAGLRNIPYALQEKYVQDLFLLKGWDVNGNTHASLINPRPHIYDHIDPTNTEDSLYLKKQLYTRFLFFGNTTLVFSNKQTGFKQSVSFESSSDEYTEYIDEVFDWLSGIDLSNFPNLQITRSNNSILLSPINEAVQIDLLNYVFETSISQVIIDFQNEWGILEPSVNVSALIYGAQSYGYNKGCGVRISWKEVKDRTLRANNELYLDGPILDLQTPTLKKTFVKDEIYRISIQFFKNASPLFAIVLGDIKTPAIGAPLKYIDTANVINIKTDEFYANQSVENSSSGFSTLELYLLAHRLEMQVDVRIPCEFKDSVDSYQIQYVERTENNRTVLAQGIAAPLVRVVAFGHPNKAGINYARNVYSKWTLPFNGGPLYSIHGLNVYDDLGENWDDLAYINDSWDNNALVAEAVTRREIPNKKMFYFDSPDIIHNRISDKNISNGKIQVLGRLNTDHTQELIRSRYPYNPTSQAHNADGIHEHYEYAGYENETYKPKSFSKKIGTKQLGGTENVKPWMVNVSIFSGFTHYKTEHEIEKASSLLNKGEIIPSAVLGTSFESVNMALTLFAQHAYNSSLWLSGVYEDNSFDRFYSETGQSSNQSEGYPSVFIRSLDNVFTDAFIGPHMTDPIYSKAHTWEGNSKTVDINGNVGASGVPNTDSHALINIKMNNEDSIYGGRSKYAFSQNVFIPLSKVIPITNAFGSNQSQRFTVQGDFYTSLYIRTKNDFSNPLPPVTFNMYQNNERNSNDHSIEDSNRGGAWAYGVVLETEVESRLSSDYGFYRAQDTADFSITLSELINSAYFKKNNLRIYNPVPFNFKDDPLLTNILSASKVKLNGDIFDSWTKFLLNEFYELEKAKGIITNVTNWGDEIYAVQELETNKINIDTSDFITTDSGEQVSVKKGDGRTFTSHEKISNFGTSIRRALAEGEFGFSFFDEFNKAFVKLAKPISLEKEIDQKLQELFECDRIIDTEGYYDNEYKETNIRIRTESGNSYMLSYNEVLGVFNGYFDYDNDIYIVFDKRVFAPIKGIKLITIDCPIINSSLNVSINKNEYFTYQITATNNPTSFSASNLPNGLSFNENIGLISGMVTTDGVYNITITATNLCGTDEANLELTIEQLAPIIVSPCFGLYAMGQNFIYQIVAINEPTSFNATGLPPELSINADGLITGILPNSEGTYNIVLYAANSIGDNTKLCDLVIGTNAPITISLGAPLCRGNSCNDNSVCSVDYAVNISSAESGDYITLTMNPVGTISGTFVIVKQSFAYNQIPVIRYTEQNGFGQAYFTVHLRGSDGNIKLSSSLSLGHQSFWNQLSVCTI